MRRFAISERLPIRGAALLGAVLCLALAGQAGAATFKVNCDNRNLQNRIDAVPAGSTLLVKGTCDPVTIDKNLTLEGNPKATIDAEEVGRPVTIEGTPTVKLLDLRITGGHVSGVLAQGGGIYHQGGPLTLRRVVVAGNAAEASGGIIPSAYGGGIYSDGATLRLVGSHVRNNVATAASGACAAYGGGIFRLGKLVLENSSVTSNRTRAETSTGGSNAAASAGAIFVSAERVTFVGSHLDRNRATAVGTGAATSSAAAGGAAYIQGNPVLDVRRSTVSDNRAVASLAGGFADALGGGMHGSLERGSIVRTLARDNLARATSPGGANVVARGGGLTFSASQGVSIVSSRIVGSSAVATTGGEASAHGGGLQLFGPGTLTRSRVASNHVSATGAAGAVTADGGGIYHQSSLTVVGSTVHANRVDSAPAGAASSRGGGIAAEGVSAAVAALFLRASTVSENVAASDGQALGGALFLDEGGAHKIYNSTIAGNRANGATARGGAIDVAGELDVRAATIARNSAKIGGGLYVEGATTTLRATILAANSAPSGPNCSQNVASAGRNLVGTAGCAFASVGTDKVNVASKLGRLGTNGGPTQTIPLLRGSPALNAIPAAPCPFARDQRGVRRPQGPRCDIGAFERRPGSRP